MTKLKQRRSAASQQLKSAVKPKTYTEPHLLGGESSSTSGLSSHVQISSLPGRGRGLLATSPIHLGDTLLIEDAYISYNSTKGAKFFCHHCLHKLPLGLGTVYCMQPPKYTVLHYSMQDQGG